VPAVLNEAKLAHDALIVAHDSCTGWTPQEWQTRKDQAEKGMLHFDEKFGELRDFAKNIESVYLEHRTSNASSKRKDRLLRSNAAKACIEGGVPEALSRLISTSIEGRLKDGRRESFYVNSGGASSCPSLEYQALGDFANACGFCMAPADKESFYHKQLNLSALTLKNAIDEKSQKAAAHIAKNKKIVTLCSRLPGSAGLNVTDPSEKDNQPFSCSWTSNGVVRVQRCWDWPQTFESRPFMGVGSFFAVVDGYVWVATPHHTNQYRSSSY
jgi:hypothetical protein